ncbi:hypothetical protein BDM02DRAFT_3089366 [Thelephora ganbajun]|uniref:Uncharacterized protein n=1 Tax=Thelephora ganbajun TaxID=370292 RepID=A0ACB6ZS79_THEGA|nr:hypothetical protein BDM02DRAFT_3089366 [Thelephora ganbajun]
MPATTNKQPFVVYNAPVSAPTSPATTRRGHHNPPVTPQRITRSAPRQQQYHFSPLTPATNASTPYTPLSLRSLSSNGSTLTTPISAASRRLSLTQSPEVGIQMKNQRQTSLADIAHNWRNRVNENGIKVTSSRDSQYADDEGNCLPSPDVISWLLTPNRSVLSPSPLLPIQRRSRALSYAGPPQPALRVGYTVPNEPCTPNRKTLATLNTPSPNASIISKLKIKGSTTEPPAPRRRFLAQPITSELCDIDEDEYTPYPPAFPTANQTYGQPLYINDPFNATNIPAFGEPAFSVEDSIPFQVIKPEVSSCSICGLRANTLAILEPCTHPLCSACLTSALNIVGEKDMQCAVCKANVENFHLKSFNAKEATPRPAKTDIMDSLLPSAFDVNPFFVPPTNPAIPRSSTPVGFVSPTARGKDSVVLRIDNVPWDITPPMIVNWLKQPVGRAHVLLDRKGKTLSHVFVEMANEEAAKVALRTTQNSVLGQGKRARGVTVTRSNQEELMKALFPSWQGKFDGSRPSLAGLPNETVVATLQAGLMTEGELSALLHLIRSPDSHFLKVPCLPFYSLISILSKFPSDVDSRVFWSSALRDFLYAAVQILVSRGTSNNTFGHPNLLPDLLEAGVNCQAFTELQIGRLSDLVDTNPERTVASSVNTSNCDLRSSPATSSSSNKRNISGSSIPVKRRVSHGASSSRGLTPDITNFDDIAKEFGVGPDLVEALAQRLSGLY